ncbi:MAG: DUF3014 domain-containing protein [Gammaproteobacteria bacterium]
MNETNAAMNLPEKSGFGIGPWFTSGIATLIVAALFGAWYYFSGTTGPDSRPHEQFAPRVIDEGGTPAETPRALPDAGPYLGPRSSGLEKPEGTDEEPGSNEVLAPLPRFDESDDLVRSEFVTLSARPEPLKWIATEQLIPKITLVVENVSKGAIPRARIRDWAPEGKFPAIEKGPDQYIMDPEGYHRYDGYADTLASVDPTEGLRVYRTLEPLFDAAYRELGYPDARFEPILRKAIRHLLAVPVLSGEIALVRPSVTYRFADPDIESLSRAQKQLLRMGPRNTRIIQAKLREFLAALDRTEASAELNGVRE